MPLADKAVASPTGPLFLEEPRAKLGGIALGWLLTVGLRRVLASVIEIHAAQDAALLAGLTAILVIIGVATSLLPARRAATIDPMQALRQE